MAIDGVLAWFRAWPILKWGFEKVAHYSQRPALSLHIDSRPKCAVQTPVTVLPPRWNAVEAASKARSNYYRLQVKNTGRTIARNVQVQLTDIWYVERGIWKRLKEWHAANLPWIGRAASTTVDLHPAQDDFCDVGHVQTNALQNDVPLPQGERLLFKNDSKSRHQALFVLAPERRFQHLPSVLDRGHYVLGVRAYADNAESAAAFIDLAFPGRFAELGDDRMPGPLGGVEISMRAEPPEVYAVDRHPVDEREPFEHPGLPPPSIAALRQSKPPSGPTIMATDIADRTTEARGGLAVKIAIHPNIGAGCTPGAQVRGTSHDPVEARSAKFVLTDALRWDDSSRCFVKTRDTHPIADFQQLTMTGSADLFCGESTDFGFIFVENGRLRIPGHRDGGTDDCRIGRAGIWRLSGYVVAADGRRRHVQVCFNWEGGHSIPKPTACPDAVPSATGF